MVAAGGKCRAAKRAFHGGGRGNWKRACGANGAAEDVSRYTTLLTGDGAEHTLKNRREYTFDLTKFVKDSGSVAIRFSDASPADGWGAWVASAELRVGGQIAASFRAGSDIENRFLRYDNGSQFDGAARFAGWNPFGDISV